MNLYIVAELAVKLEYLYFVIMEASIFLKDKIEIWHYWERNNYNY